MSSHSFQLIGAIQDCLPPGLVIEVPGDSFAEAGLVILSGLPAELVADFGSVDGIAEIMARAIGDEGDEGFRGRRSEGRGQGRGCSALFQFFVEDVAEEEDEVDIAEFIVATDIVGIAWGTVFEDG